jgi:ABC-type branched-subunit amino acid transport system substrate-binding protein
MTTNRFPPRVGWIPIGIGLAAITALSVWSVAPQFSNKVIGAVTQRGPGGAGLAPDSTGATPGAGAGTGGTGSTSGQAVGSSAGAACAPGRNGGATAPGVTATQINIASTIVTTGVGAGFLGQAVDGMQAAINQVNNAGGICGRRVVLHTLNDSWDRNQGAGDISAWINSGSIFSLVAEPDSEGLDAVSNGSGGNRAVDNAGIPVVGTDGMLTSQYHDPMIFPVAASTVSNMHIIAQYAYAHGARNFGIVFDTSYKFGKEGASAFNAEVQRLTGHAIPGYNSSLSSCNQQFCGIPSSGSGAGYSTYVQSFDNACGNAGGKPCDAVVMLLEPQPMQTWMSDESGCGCHWYGSLYGGEPLFDDTFAQNCGGGCGQMTVWTGYRPAIQPFAGESAVYTYAQALKAINQSLDPQNEFTEGAYLGTTMFLQACKQVGPNLTRSALLHVLSSATFNFGLSSPLRYAGNHLANTSMAAFSDNATQNGTFNGWSYIATNPQFLPDRDPANDQ